MSRFGVMHGPYASQLTDYHFKLWFAFIPDDGKMTRYQLAYHLNDPDPITRHREIFEGKVPQYKANFNEYLPPDDIQSYPGEHFPRHKGDTIKAVLVSLLTDQYLADVIKFSRFGILPILAKDNVPKKYHDKIQCLEPATHGNTEKQ